MKTNFLRLGPATLALVLVLGGTSAVLAQPASTPESAAAKPAGGEELNQAELLKAYLQVREQLHATQMAIVNNRVEALTEKLDTIRSTMEAERDRQLAENQRAIAERERQHLETQRANRTVLWVAAAFGGVGLLAMMIMPFFQWRAIARISETGNPSTQLAVVPPTGLLSDDPTAGADQTVNTSNRRLMSVIDRMEQRILELEHTATPSTVSTTTNSATPFAAPSVPASAGTALPTAARTPPSPQNGHRAGATESPRRTSVDTDQATWITVLLNKGKGLLAANKAREAVACYDEILKLDAHQPEALVRKGSALERLNRFEEALQCYERAIAADDRMTLAYVSKGGVCNRLGRFDEALECYEQALHAAEKK